jgi:hypothetical protein
MKHRFVIVVRVSHLSNKQTIPILIGLREAVMAQATELTIDQEFSLRLFEDQVKQMSREQAQEFLIEQHKLMMVQKTMFQKLLKHEWSLV